jgi:hypothetical protein
MISEPGSLNKAYRRYFLDHPQKVRRDLERLDRYLLEHRCIFRGVAMPTLLKPNFLSPAQAELLKGSVETMSRALTRVISLFLEDSRVQEIMGFSAMEHELFRIDPGYSNPLVISRLDAFLLGDGIKFLEFNCDSPAGIAYSDILEEGLPWRSTPSWMVSGWNTSTGKRHCSVRCWNVTGSSAAGILIFRNVP